MPLIRREPYPSALSHRERAAPKTRVRGTQTAGSLIRREPGFASTHPTRVMASIVTSSLAGVVPENSRTHSSIVSRSASAL